MAVNFCSFRDSLNPGLEAVAQALEPARGDLLSLALCPTGGETIGTLVVGALPRSQVVDESAALLTLWKASACYHEEFPYEKWSRERVDWVRETLLEPELARWRSGEQHAPRETVNYLLQLAPGVVTAQRDLQRPVNPAQYQPSQAAVVAAGLEALEFVREEALLSVLCDGWNELLIAFQDSERVYLVDWTTSA